MIEYEQILSELQCLKHLSIVGLHGQMIQKKRTAILESFTAQPNTGVMCCTDVAARGIDIPDIDWIVQYDPPQDPSFFIHRIGRTARMGKRGRSIVMLTPPPLSAKAAAAAAAGTAVDDDLNTVAAGELEYVDFLRHQHVPIHPLPIQLLTSTDADSTANGAAAAAVAATTSTPGVITGIADVLREVKQLALDDRDVMEKGSRAYVSFVRAYKEHHCGLIFVLARLPFADLARGMGLLYVCVKRAPPHPTFATVS